MSGLIKSMRPRQSTKNLLVFGALIFIPGAIFEPEAWFRTVLAFFLFSFAASAGYIFNDIRDINYDRGHPVKRTRPIASGQVAIPAAIILALILLALSFAGSIFLDTSGFALGRGSQPLNGLPFPFTLTILGYLLITVLYSFFLKTEPVLDVIVLSIGFVLRAVAGAVALKVHISPWLLLCTGLLALFLGFGKRRQEIVRLQNTHGTDAKDMGRESLSGYSIPLLDNFLMMAGAANIMSYSFYTFDSQGHSDYRLMLTIPFVIYGFWRYIYLIHKFDSGESPEEVLIKDMPLKLCLLTWIGSVIVLFLV